MAEIGKTFWKDIKKTAVAVGLTVATSVAAACGGLNEVKQAPPPVVGPRTPAPEPSTGGDQTIQAAEVIATEAEARIKSEEARRALEETIMDKINKDKLPLRRDSEETRLVEFAGGINSPGQTIELRITTREGVVLRNFTNWMENNNEEDENSRVGTLRMGAIVPDVGFYVNLYNTLSYERERWAVIPSWATERIGSEVNLEREVPLQVEGNKYYLFCITKGEDSYAAQNE